MTRKIRINRRQSLPHVDKHINFNFGNFPYKQCSVLLLWWKILRNSDTATDFYLGYIQILELYLNFSCKFESQP